MTHQSAIIGSGFSGLSAAAFLAQQGLSVDIYEKHSSAGGRARQFTTVEGYKFDMGPSWYWMPEIFEKFFASFGKNPSDYYHLKKLDPAFRMVFGPDEVMDIPSDYTELLSLFEKTEKGAGRKLQEFMEEAGKKYRLGIDKLMYNPSLSLTEFAGSEVLMGLLKLQVFSSFSKHVKKHFSDPRLISLMEFPVLFLGAMPEKTPALYSLMNYAGLKQGTWYPMGGFAEVVKGLSAVATGMGANIHFSSAVSKINVKKGKANFITVNGNELPVDSIIATGDYHHIEKDLLPEDYSNYSESYWNKKTFAPSSLIFFLGLNKKIERLLHHNLFFDENLDKHSRDIYIDKVWPEKPLFYVCCPSKTDPSVAPAGHENLFILMPIATGLEDTEALREKYFAMIMQRLSDFTAENITSYIDYKRSYCVNDFISDYSAYKGNAYGLANTLFQTGTFKPKIKNHKISNLFYAGQLTVPGPGVPPAIISGEIAAVYMLKNLKFLQDEITV